MLKIANKAITLISRRGNSAKNVYLCSVGNDYSMNVRGRLMTFDSPRVMGVMNVTPDSFYASSRKQTDEEVARRTAEMIAQGADIIDVGACSTRPGAAHASEEEEMTRLRHGLAAVRNVAPEAVLSVDTFRPDVARMAVEEYGVDIINDVSGGCEDSSATPPMFAMAARLGVPYILMSSRPTVEAIMEEFSHSVARLRSLGVKDIILDPGFGFGKTLEQNYAVLSRMDVLGEMGLPLLVGMSRKTMVWKPLCISPEQALNGTTVLNTLALCHGASILRVHDVREAVETIRIVRLYCES